MAAAAEAEEFAEQDMRLAERGKMAPPEHVATRDGPSLISAPDVEFWWEHGYLRIPQVFSAEEMDALTHDFEWLVADWASDSAGWQGPWRKVLMDEKTEENSKLIAMHDLHHYSTAWMQAITKPSLGEALGKMIGGPEFGTSDDGNVEVHHSTMHIKPPETGHPFPMHQDQVGRGSRRSAQTPLCVLRNRSAAFRRAGA
jgi:phytanoyl-CoA hydroxylase